MFLIIPNFSSLPRILSQLVSELFSSCLLSKRIFALFCYLPALIKLDFDMEKSLQGYNYLFQKMRKCPIYTVELDSDEYLLKHYVKVIFSRLRNAKWPYLDLFCCLKTLIHLWAVGMAGIIS
jgi:hypothetical protein